MLIVNFWDKSKSLVITFLRQYKLESLRTFRNDITVYENKNIGFGSSQLIAVKFLFNTILTYPFVLIYRIFTYTLVPKTTVYGTFFWTVRNVKTHHIPLFFIRYVPHTERTVYGTFRSKKKNHILSNGWLYFEQIFRHSVVKCYSADL